MYIPLWLVQMTNPGGDTESKLETVFLPNTLPRLKTLKNSTLFVHFWFFVLASPFISLNVPISKPLLIDVRRHGGNYSRRSRLQLYKHQPLSVLAKWQARQRGFPRLCPPAAPDVPDVFLQFLLFKRTR